MIHACERKSSVDIMRGPLHAAPLGLVLLRDMLLLSDLTEEMEVTFLFKFSDEYYYRDNINMLISPSLLV